MNSDRFKFRVWNKDKKEYDDSHDIVLTPSGELMELYSVCCNYVIEQCTGIYDCAGNPIFEGDVVKTVTGASGPVVWSGGRAGFVVRLTGVCCSLADTQKIVGNVHTR